MKFDSKTAIKTAVVVIAALGVLIPDVQACGKSPGDAGISALRLFAPLHQSESSQAENASPETTCVASFENCGPVDC